MLDYLQNMRSRMRFEQTRRWEKSTNRRGCGHLAASICEIAGIVIEFIANVLLLIPSLCNYIRHYLLSLQNCRYA